MGRHKRSMMDRFLAKVRKTDTCWFWEGSQNRNGYGRINLPGTKRKIAAHRLSFELFNGPLIPGLFILHSCDTPLCVNPDHLSQGTPLENAEDRDRKGRFVHGCSTAMARMKAEIVRLRAEVDYLRDMLEALQ